MYIIHAYIGHYIYQDLFTEIFAIICNEDKQEEYKQSETNMPI